MIGMLRGKVVFSDGSELILETASGVGYQMHCHYIFPEGGVAHLFISHIVRETAELLFAFRSLREKKAFELLTTVKGVGPKSAYNIVSQIGVDQMTSAIQSEQKKILTQVSGVGDKAASQIILDLKKKVVKMGMYTNERISEGALVETVINKEEKIKSTNVKPEKIALGPNHEEILNDTLLACQNLGFATEKVVPLAQKILKENAIQKPEQLVHLVLKEI